MNATGGESPINLVSVVMPTYNGASTITEQLEALARQTHQGEWELVVADNGSTDDTLEIVRGWTDRLPLRLVNVSDGRGVSYTCNAGAAESKGDFIVFCHQDDVASPGWLEAMARASRHCDIVAGGIDYDRLNDPVTASWHRLPSEDDLPTALGFLPYGIGANLGMRTAAFEALGGWSEDLVWGGEDVDLCWRAQLASYRFCYEPEALMHFRLRSDVDALFRQRFSYGRAEPHLYKTFRARGVPRSNTWRALITWAWALVHLPDYFGSAERKGNWVRKVAYHWGRLRGSIDARVLYL